MKTGGADGSRTAIGAGTQRLVLRALGARAMSKRLRLPVAGAIACMLLLSGCSDAKPDGSAQKGEQPAVPQVKILSWGPHFTRQAQGFAVQANGNSAIWFEQRGIGNVDMVEIWFGDRRLDRIVITPNVGGSAEVPPDLIQMSGLRQIYFILKPSGAKVEVGTFEVTVN